MTEQKPERRPDPTFKLITNRLAQEVGLKLVNAEFPQILSADMVLEIPESAKEKLESSIFNFVKGYQYGIVEFKGQNDPLTLPKFLTNLARTALFSVKKEDVAVNQILNLYVYSQFPEGILGATNPASRELVFTNTSEHKWLWQAGLFFQEIKIVVCRDLPLEPRYYEWLIFAPANTVKWREFVKMALKEGRRDIIEMVIKLRPKEFKAMTIDVKEILSQLDPQERDRIDTDLIEVLAEDLPRLAVEKPQIFDKLLDNLAENLPPERLNEVARYISDRARKKTPKNGKTSKKPSKE